MGPQAVTRHFDTRSMQFFITRPSACPYLPDRQERKVFAHLDSASGPGMVDAMTRAGFRRSQNVIYRPACERCDACLSARVPVPGFVATRSQRRAIRANRTVEAQEMPAEATAEQFALLKRYLGARHPGGGMNDMNFGDYVAMVEGAWSRSRIFEYRLPGEGRAPGRLIGVALTDLVADGLSMVYSFYDPDIEKRSLGTFVILHHLEETARRGGQFVYLGYWVPGSAKMDYKARFRPLQVLRQEGWVALDG
jgi:arginine-tRNA-protein transferase